MTTTKMYEALELHHATTTRTGWDIQTVGGDRLLAYNIRDEQYARLFAAAPALYAAVAHVFEAAEDGGDMNDIDWDKLRSALALVES